MLSGAMSALITPFKHSAIDETAFEYLIKRQIQYGMDGCVPVGTTGESATLTHEEHMQCIEIAVNVCKGSGVAVLAGAGSNSTSEAIDIARFSQKVGADGVLCVCPYYHKAIAKSIEIPLILYNVPSRTGLNIDTKTVIRLFEDIDNITGLKEASGLLEKVVEYDRYVPQMHIFSGDDAINYPILATGGKGVISVTGNLLPDKISKLTKHALQGDLETSRKINSELYDINKILFCETNPGPIKAAMYLSGLIKHLEYRLPLVEPSKSNMQLIENTLQNYEVLK